MKKLLMGVCLMALLAGCSKSFTGAEVRDQLNSSVETMIDWDCLGKWESQTLAYNGTIRDDYFTAKNFNSYNLTKADSKDQGIKLMHAAPYKQVRVVTVLSPTEAIITPGGWDSNTLYYFNTKSVKDIKNSPTFYDGQWVPIEDNTCLALDGKKTHSYQSTGGVRTVQNVTLIPRAMKNQHYKPVNKN